MRELDSLTPERCQEKVISDYVRYFGSKAANPSKFVLHRWDLEDWLRGGPFAVSPPNVLAPFGEAMTQPVNGLYFAGSETSEYWTGYIDGAVRSGHRVAREICPFSELSSRCSGRIPALTRYMGECRDTFSRCGVRELWSHE